MPSSGGRHKTSGRAIEQTRAGGQTKALDKTRTAAQTKITEPTRVSEQTGPTKASEKATEVEPVQASELRQRSSRSEHSRNEESYQILVRAQLAEGAIGRGPSDPGQARHIDSPQQPIQTTSADEAEDVVRNENTGSTIRTPPGSPRTQLHATPLFDPDDDSSFDRTQIKSINQQLDIRKLFQGTGDILPDPSVVVEKGYIIPRMAGRNIIMRVTIHDQQFACKIVWTRDEQGQETYKREKEVLKVFRNRPHWHVAFLACYYVSPKNESCLILSPLAGGNLREFLSQDPTPGRRAMVARWFGCLATALAHMHSQKVKHKDIKSMNILIHGENIIITDMGISRQYEGNNSETYGHPYGTPVYMAPEMHRDGKGGRTQDTWSLLCCFIEMFAFLRGFTLPEFRQTLEETDKPFHTFYHNHAKVVKQLSSMRPQIVDRCERELLDFILRSFMLDPKRPKAAELVEGLEAIQSQALRPYVGECCAKPADNSSEVPITREMSKISTEMDFRTLPKGSLLRFVLEATRTVAESLPSVMARKTMSGLLEDVKRDRVHTIRSAERKLLFIIAPKSCKDGGEYLSLCRAFMDCLADAYASGQYEECLYDRARGEHERAYSTKYFEVLAEEVRNRCRTYQWNSPPAPTPEI